MTSAEILTYGTCVALGARAALLQGPPGAGKSDLALRFIAAAYGMRQRRKAALVADDQVLLRTVNGRLMARPPAALAGKLEVRGLGIIELPYCPEAQLKLVVTLSEPYDVPRFPPDPLTEAGFLAVAVPVLRVAPFESSAPLKLWLALERFC